MATFYFDFLSPYAYLAWRELPALSKVTNLDFKPTPVLFAAMLNQWGHKGPAEIPPKRVYVMKNALRLGHRLGHPIEPPPEHPFNPILPLRIAGLDEPRQSDIIDALFRAVWNGGPGIADEIRVRQVLDKAGFDGPDLVHRAGQPLAKARLRENTDAAIAAGVFGVPTFVVEGELFWGVDSLPDVVAFAQGKDPVNPSLVQRWMVLPAAAQRNSQSG